VDREGHGFGAGWLGGIIVNKEEVANSHDARSKVQPSDQLQEEAVLKRKSTVHKECPDHQSGRPFIDWYQERLSENVPDAA